MAFKTIESIADDGVGLIWLVEGVSCRRVGLYDLSDIEKHQEGEYLFPYEDLPDIAYKVIDELEDGGKVSEIRKKSLIRDLALQLFYEGFFKDTGISDS